MEQENSERVALPKGISNAIEHMRKNLLDINKHNRLINAPVGKDRKNRLDVVDELSDEVFKILVVQKKSMTFEAAQSVDLHVGEDVDAESERSAELEVNESNSATADHHFDRKLRTSLTRDKLRTSLLTLYRDARSLEEEQGVSVLFLALGFLRWFENESSETEHYAPLVLLPVQLDRDSAGGRFRLAMREDEFDVNLSLKALLANDFGLMLPDFPEGDWLPSEYFESVRSMVETESRWSVESDRIDLSFYSFAKFLMWRDLDPDSELWREQNLEENALLRGLLADGFESSPEISVSGENLDQRFKDPTDLLHVMDADASQTLVIAAAREGRNLVVQGPPGTGKSQTITNIIAGAVSDGKTVLFVAEKRAALDVVYERLKKCNLDQLCLELHSRKAIRRHVYNDLNKTLGLSEPADVDESDFHDLRKVRDELNRMSDLLHNPDKTTGETPYRNIGSFALLEEAEQAKPDFDIDEVGLWSVEEFDERCKAVTKLANLTASHGCELEHPWRGASASITTENRRQITAAIVECAEQANALRNALETAEVACGLEGVFSGPIDRAVDLAKSQLAAVDAMPKCVPALLDSVALLEQPDAALALCQRVQRFRKTDSKLRKVVIDSAFDVDWNEVRQAVAAHGGSILRMFNADYRQARALLRAVARERLPKPLPQRLNILDGLLEHRKLQRDISRDDEFGKEVFDRAWRGLESNLGKFLPAVNWIASQAEALESGKAVQRQVATLAEGHDLNAIAEDIRKSGEGLEEAWNSVVKFTDLDMSDAFGVPTLGEVGLPILQERLADPRSIETWRELIEAAQSVSELGLGDVRERLADGRLENSSAVYDLRFIRAVALRERMVNDAPDIEHIDGRDRTKKVEQFKGLDIKLQKLSARKVALTHFKSIPRGARGDIGIVRGEVNKKTRHMRIRKLLDKAGNAVASIKPVFLMSPLSVAQYLKPGGLMFDLLLIDEASQVRPQDAIGAILRARQVVVVGDQKQLPPTSFFDRKIGGDEDDGDYDEDPISQVGDFESILSLCSARGMAESILCWHYRSQHDSLIEVSNREFYDHKLIYPLSPDLARIDSGLTFTHVKDGVYRPSKGRDNPNEAKAICNAVLEHARKCPNLTLGVVALSIAQRDTISNLVESLRAENPELESFCKESCRDPFFVKNLENVQGDERDVIFISIGYGKDADGKMAHRFGPVSNAGGERRLNVLFTRAKRQCRVFSSIQHHDIRLDATKQLGPRVLKMYLQFAQTRKIDVPVIPENGEPDSPFEEAVAEALQKNGYKVAHQVGSAGFRIDLAVYDPDDDGRFLLAVECDGASYHSSSWARERDRLRQSILESKDWKFHRIWSTDWFKDAASETEKLLDALDRARSDTGGNENGSDGSGGVSGEGCDETRKRESDEKAGETQASSNGASSCDSPDSQQGVSSSSEVETEPYVEANFEIPQARYRKLHDAPTELLMNCITEVVAVEGPVSVEEVCRRINALWGNRRGGSRIRAAVTTVARMAARKGLVLLCANGGTPFLDIAGRTEAIPVRDRSRVKARTLREIENLPPSEIETGILRAIELNVGIETDECASEVARMLGFRTTSAQLRQLIVEQVGLLSAEGRLVDQGGHLSLARVAAKRPESN